MQLLAIFTAQYATLFTTDNYILVIHPYRFV